VNDLFNEDVFHDDSNIVQSHMNSSRIGFGTKGRHRLDSQVNSRLGSNHSIMRTSTYMNELHTMRAKSVQGTRVGMLGGS
jgi:hypothetical protein